MYQHHKKNKTTTIINKLNPWVKALDEKGHTPKEKAMREKRTAAVAIFDDLESRHWDCHSVRIE